MLRFATWLTVAACLLCGCRSERPRAATPVRPPQSSRGPSMPSPAPEQGKASYYADSLAGNPTASGEPYDPRALTAAHRTLPFGTIVDVVRRDDGRAVRVRINDRGPHKEGRVVDLSRAAAEQVGMIEAGIVDVSVSVVPLPPR